MAMAFMEDDDLMDAGYDDFPGADDFLVERRGERRRGPTGPKEVTFSVFVDAAPEDGQVVVLKGNLPELRDGVGMRPCETGNGRLWKCNVQLDPPAPPRVDAAAGAGNAGVAGGNILGGFGMFAGGFATSGGTGMQRALPTLFEVTYVVLNQDNQPVREATRIQERGHQLQLYYYHRAKLTEDTTEVSEAEAFPLFIHEEIHLLQSGATSVREFLTRFLRLADTSTSQRRSLLNKALDDLIQNHWGLEARPPAQTVLSVAATLGYFRRLKNHSHASAFAPVFDDHPHAADISMSFAPDSKQPGAEKEADTAPSLLVCRWIVKHCPARSELQEEDEDRHARDRDRDSHLGSHVLNRYSQLGVLQAAETLYIGEKTFEWLRLLEFLPEHSLPPPLNASECLGEERDKLLTSFEHAMAQVFDDFQRQLQAMHLAGVAGEDPRENEQSQVEVSLRGLCAFCPSVAGLHSLVTTVRRDFPAYQETMVPLVFGRIRTLHFGPQDKEALRTMVQEVPLMHSDDTAISLLTNQHHPSNSFPAEEIVQIVKLVSETRESVRPAGAQLQNAMRRWLNRHYGRPPERKDPEHTRKDERHDGSVGSMSRAEYQERKGEIREAIRRAIEAWYRVLMVPCFKQEEETLRMILFEFSQACFIKDTDPIMLLDCMLELEQDIHATGSLRPLEMELERIAIKAVRDAQDTSESMHSEELLRLLFETPTLLRFTIIEAFIGLRQASADLGKILLNEPIWCRLLSKEWLEIKNFHGHQLSLTQGHGRNTLNKHATELRHGTIQLQHLRTILTYREVYQKLVTQTSTCPDNIDQSEASLRKFDTEFKHLQSYVKLFCAVGGIEASSLMSLIDEIKIMEHALELNVAVKKFDGLLVRPHLDWLYSLRASNVFADIWTCTVKEAGEKGALKQEYVVANVIPAARQKWEALARSIEGGTAILKDIRWCVDLDWKQVKMELRTLHDTVQSSKDWVPHAEKLTKDMRLAAKLREWSPSMLHLKSVLADIFSKGSLDACVKELELVVKEFAQMWEMRLGCMVEKVEPFRNTINMLSEPMQDYTIVMAKHDEWLKWLLKHGSTEEFNRLISLCRPNTDDSVILAAIASLQQTRTFLAGVLYENCPYQSLHAFLKELQNLTMDPTVHESLLAVQKSFDPMLDLLTTHSRTPGVQACYDLKKIHDGGVFSVICSLKDGEQLICRVAPDQVFTYENLAELRRQLLMADVPAELDGATNLPEMLEELVEKLHLLEEYGQCTKELFTLGHFAFHAGQTVLSVKPEQASAEVERLLQELQQKLMDWQAAVDAARGKHYYLNYFTVRELCFLVKRMPQVKDVTVWDSVWPLLRVLDLEADQKCVYDHVLRDIACGNLSRTDATEVELLNMLGTLLGRLFEKSRPTVRPLKDLQQARQQLQGDLLIRSMQRSEQGVPVFVCCADEPSKVTELVLSIYARRERVPEAEELLLCSSHTTVEQIELLLRRFFLARAHGREERLYCLGNVHLLPYVVQCGAVEALTRLEETFGFSNASALVFVSGLQNQMMTNALNRHNLAVSVLPNAHLVEAVAKIGERYHGRQLEAVVGEINGVGKTHYIYRQVCKAQEEHYKKPVMHHVEIRENTDISALVASLLSDPTDPSTPTAVYIDLAHILPSHVDTLLFELLVVGMLRDTQHQSVYHRRPQDFFLVEVPNTPSELTAKQLSFCLLLPRTVLRMGPKRLDPEMPITQSLDVGSRRALFVKFENNANLELVGKTLAAMKVEAFNPKSKDFNVMWTAATAPVVDIEKTYEHLEELCSSATSPPSFLVFMNFVKFLGALVLMAESWNIMNLQLLQNFDVGLKIFKQSFYRLLIETARNFALRQVPKQMDAAAALTALMPLALTRTRSGASGGLVRARSNESVLGDGVAAAAIAGAPALARQRSHRSAEATQAHAAEADAAIETSGVGRIGARSYVQRFDQMPSWETCVHPVASFKKNEHGQIIGCNIMSLAKDFLAEFIDRNLQNALNLNDLKLEKDWSKVTHQEAVNLVHQIEGGELLRHGASVAPPTEYVITVDNLLKIMSIQQRLKFGLPVILMGETGCGKTALVKFLSRTLNFRLYTLDIHGGITDEAIINFLDQAIRESGDDQNVLVFFDEINAANCMALFKTIIIDRVCANKRIPENIRIISCCNPYRLRRGDELEDVALVFQHQIAGHATGITDPMKKLVYRVHPLPESLIDIVSDFGSLSEKSEELYINAILRKELPNNEDAAAEGAPAPNADTGADGSDSTEYDTFVTAFRELLCQSQRFVREVNGGERSVVSMRDIARAARVFKWFLTYYSKLRGVSSVGATDERDGLLRLNITVEMRPHLRSAVILTLGYCYHSRLTRDQRCFYRRRLCDTWKRMRDEDAAVDWLKMDSAKELEEMLTKTQLDFVSQMDLGEGIALNEALRENLFMLLVSIMNQIPILLIGKPGCSKSLAMGVLQNNLNGDVSNKEFFKSMPAVDVVAYQCSPLSTPDAILNTFHSARQSNIGNRKTIVCVLLDEVGLAEESPHLPLKVLHRELEDLRGIACVSISNWALDAAKMSRCVTLYRPPPTVEDLCITAEGMVASGNLKGYLRCLSEAFAEIYRTQGRTDFWGMREFYSTVRVINSELKAQMAEGKTASVEPQLLMKTVQRNFGGRPAQELEQCVHSFFERVGMSFESVRRYTMAELIRQNLTDPDARHLMLLTKNNAALRLLFESGLLDHGKAEVMFGSTFPNDQSDVFVAVNLQRIKSFMQQPISLVMVHCDSLYESLYDLLNQHYMEFNGRRYVRIAHGSKAKQCPIHNLFRVIVVTEINDAYFRLAPPLLNRFEKQIFLRKDIMERGDEALLNRLGRFWESLSECLQQAEPSSPKASAARVPRGARPVRSSAASSSSSGAPPPLKTIRPAGQPDQHRLSAPHYRAIAGFHGELLSSLVFMLRRRNVGDTSMDQDQLFEEAKLLLTKVLTPEAVCIIASQLDASEMKLKFGFDLVSEYFEKQRHSDLPSFTEQIVSDKSAWCDAAGAQVMVLTYSPIRGKVGHELQGVTSTTPAELSLHELSSSQDIEKSVQQFYASAPAPSADGTMQRRFLVIHADPIAASPRMIEHCRFVCEKLRSEFLKSGRCVTGSMFVMLVVHLQRGLEGGFSFDYDSQWHFVFLDSVEPSVDLNSMPPLGRMLNMPLIDVVVDLDFSRLLQSCFRASLSRLIYPHSRRPEDLQRQIRSILRYLEDDVFVTIVRDWIIRVMMKTPKNSTRPEEGTVGQDRNWFAAIASAAHELALAGTFRAALHNRIAVLVGSLLTVLLAHLDRNGGLALLGVPEKRQLWLSLSEASLSSELSARLHNEAINATQELATAQHEVGTDAQTGAKPFEGRFPASWFVSRSIDGLRHMIETLPEERQMEALTTQYQLSKLHDAGLRAELDAALLDDYIADFTAMHLNWTQRIDRETQARLLTKIMRRNKGTDLVSILEVHRLFWSFERQIAYCVSLLNAVPGAVLGAEKLIDTSEPALLNLDLLLLVHTTLTAELSCDNQAPVGNVNQFYREWLSRKTVVAGLTQDYLADRSFVAHEKLAMLKCDTEPRIETLALVLEHVAVPLHIDDLSIVKRLASELPPGKIRQAKTLSALLEMAKGVAEREAARGEKYRDISLNACSTFLESWVLDVCLRDAEAISDLDEECLRLICGMAAGLPVVIHRTLGVAAGNLSEWSEHQDCGIATLGASALTIPRSQCLNLALLRKLIAGSEGEAKRKAKARIESLLKEISVHEKHNDTTFATRYTVLCEEEATQQLKGMTQPSEWPTMSLQEVFRRPDANASPAFMLQDVGKIRWILTQYATILCGTDDDEIDEKLHAEAVAKVNPLLQTDDENLQPVCRSMRLYLLKCVERRRGISFLRGLLAQETLQNASWVMKWRLMHDIDFEKFIGAALVPKWNPFLGEDFATEYQEAKVVVYEMMQSTAVDKLERFAKDCKTQPAAQQKRSLGGLLMALCQEPGLLAALEEEGRKPPWRLKLNEWLATSTELPVTEKERMLLRIFAGDESAINVAEDAHRTSLRAFVISGGRSMDDILRWRLLGHLAAALIAAPPTTVLATLRKVMLDPADLMYGENTYLPSMDEDIRNQVMKALIDRGENIWKFKTHWYKCSCGYEFFIGECGRPMETVPCPNCKLEIGGRDHNKTTHTEEDDEQDRSPQGYMLPEAERDERHIVFREVRGSSARAIRLLLHGSMLCGLAAEAKDPMPRIFDHLVNRDSLCSMHQSPEAKYIWEHFSRDWKLMVEIMSSNTEDLAVGLHNLLRKMSGETRDEPKGAAANGPEPNWEKLNLESRNKWEETVEIKYLKRMANDLESQLPDLYKKWGDATEDGKFVAELKEAADVRDFPRLKREAEMPQLWAFRSPVTLDTLHAHLSQHSSAQSAFPVLCTVLQRPLFPVLPALGLLAGLFEWHSLVLNRFSGRISRSKAGELRVGRVIESISNPSEKDSWERAYAAFEMAWQIAWPHIERHRCMEIPPHFKKIIVNRETSMLFCIADPENEGICPLELTQWLTERHNELVQVVSTAVGRRTGDERDYALRGVRQSPSVSSRLLGQHDVIKYDEPALMRFLQSRCVTYGVGGRLNFDVNQLEQQLKRELSRPEITMELRGFQWLGETVANTSELKAVIKQKELQPDVVNRIRIELSSPSLANRCLQKVQMASSFIQKSSGFSGEHAGETLLCEYLTSVLAEREEDIPSATARSEVYLWHISAFEKLLKHIIKHDPMDNVDLKYQAQLTPELSSALKAAKDKLPAALCDILASVAEEHLTNTYLGDEVPIFETLKEVSDFADDPQVRSAVEQHFPPGLKMKHWVATYRSLMPRASA